MLTAQGCEVRVDVAGFAALGRVKGIEEVRGAPEWMAK